MNLQLEKYKDELTRLSKENNIPLSVIGTIALNESGCNPNVTPYFEKTWIYFTTPEGKPLGLRGFAKIVQPKALELLGQEEFDFQVHAHGAFQTVGSVLRELGYRDKTMTKEFYAQGYFAMKYLAKMRDRFVQRFRSEPSNEQYWAMYNGGFGAVTVDGYENYVAGYIAKSRENYKQAV